MPFVFFITSLLAVSLTLQMIRLPYLVLENGGGAFLILCFLATYLVSFPMLIAEKVIDQKLRKMNLIKMIFIRKSGDGLQRDTVLLSLWFLLRIFTIFCFLWLFLYLGAQSVVYLYFFANAVFLKSSFVLDNPSLPEQNIGLIGGLAWSTFAFTCFALLRKRAGSFFMTWLLPFSLLTLVFLLLKTLGGVSDFRGLKDVFYPDFSVLRWSSLQQAIGHSLVCLLVGLGFYDHKVFSDNSRDPIELVARSCLLTLVVGTVVGGVAMPLVDQVSEHPYGVNLIFEILPRWLSYSAYGLYDCFLFFLALTLLSLYLSNVFMGLLSRNMDLVDSVLHKPSLRHGINFLYVLFNGLVIFLLQSSASSWKGQSLLLKIDNFAVHYLLPVLTLAMIWFVFRYSKPEERAVIFRKQQVFFHERVFFNLWENVAFLLVPFLLVTALVLGFF